MKLSYSEKKHGWWIETRSTVPCALSKDGLIVRFDLSDVKQILDAHYPHETTPSGNEVWYFNQTKDREIADQDGDAVYGNPQILWSHFMPKVK